MKKIRAGGGKGESCLLVKAGGKHKHGVRPKGWQ